MVNYQEEVKRLDAFVPGEKSQFWKPKAGQYRVKSLTELEPTEDFVPKGSKDPEKDKKPQVKINLLVGEENVTWTMAIGVSPASAYGQLCKFAMASGGTIKDKEFVIVVTNDGKKNTYTIVKI